MTAAQDCSAAEVAHPEIAEKQSGHDADLRQAKRQESDSQVTRNSTETREAEDESKYPGPLATFLIFLSLALATFICGFVSFSSFRLAASRLLYPKRLTRLSLPGHQLRRHNHPHRDRRVQVIQRRRLVRRLVPPRLGIFSAVLRPNLQVLLRQERLPRRRALLRHRQPDMRARTQQRRLHRRARRVRARQRGHSFGDKHYSLARRAAASSANHAQPDWRARVCCHFRRPSSRRCARRVSRLAVVFLDLSAHLWRNAGGDVFLFPR